MLAPVPCFFDYRVLVLGLQVMLRHLSRGIPDVCLLEEADPQRFLELSRTKDGAYVAINSNSKTDSEVRMPIIYAGMQTEVAKPSE